MRSLSTIFCAFVALFFVHWLSPFSTANAQFQLYRDPHNPSVGTRSVAAQPPTPISLRQHHELRSIIDVCANVGVVLPPLVDLEICLCLSALPVALETNVQLKLLVDLLGIKAVTDLVTKILLGSPDKQNCECPDHGRLICSASDPCAIACDPPYVPENHKCVCKPPYMECNGQCGYYPHGCGSAVPYAGAIRRSRTRARQIA